MLPLQKSSPASFRHRTACRSHRRPKPLTLTAKAPSLFRPIVERLGFRGQSIPVPSAWPRRPDDTTPPHTTDITRAGTDSPGPVSLATEAPGRDTAARLISVSGSLQ